MARAIDASEPDFVERYVERARADLPFYGVTALKIRDKQSRMVSLRLNTAQTIVQNILTEQLKTTGKIRAVILKARQEGVSTLTAARFFRAIHLWPGIVAMVVADSLERAGVLFDIYARYHENLPAELQPVLRATERRRYLRFSHDSSLSVRPSTDTEAGRAMTIHRLHASELAYWGTGARDTWVSLLQAVPHDAGEVIVESTAKGAGGLFHELWELAEIGDSGWVPIFLPWWIHEEYEEDPTEDVARRILEDPDDFERQAMGDGIPYKGEQHVLDLRKLAWRREVIVEKFGGNPESLGKDAVRQFQQEYPATAEEAFLVSGACFFDEDTLRIMTRETTEPIARGRLIVDNNEVLGRFIRVDPNMRGFVKIWEKPDKERHYVVGGDTAEGKLVASQRLLDSADAEHGGRDYSVAVVLRLGYKDKAGDHPPRVVAELHGGVVEVFAEQLRLLGEYYSCGGETTDTRRKALVGVERSHSSGQTVLRLLHEHYKYVPLYWAREMNRLTRRSGRRVGWITDSTSRMPMLDDLAAAVRQARLEVPSRDIVREMVTFVVWENGKPMAEEGCHDDRVIALAIALQMAREHRHGWNTPVSEWEANQSQTGY